MASSYPGALDSLATNKTNNTKQVDDHPAHHNDLADAVNKIEVELGTNPSGASPTVKALLADLAAAAGFTDTSGFIQRSLMPFNVKDYGAVGDGTTNDYPAFQAAFDAAMAVPGSTVYAPAPATSYKLNSTVVVEPPSGTQVFVNFVCDGNFNAITWGGADDTPVFQLLGLKFSRWQGVRIRIPDTASGVIGLDLDGNASGTYTSCSNNGFYDVLVSSHESDSQIGWRIGHNGLNTDFSFNSWVNCHVTQDTKTGTSIGWAMEGANALNNNWYGCAAGQLAKGWTNTSTAGARYAHGGASMWFHGCGASSNTTDYEFGTVGPYGIFGGRYELGEVFIDVQLGAASNAASVTVENVQVENYAGDANRTVIHMASAGALVLNGLRIDQSSSGGGSAFPDHGIYLEGGGGGYGSVTFNGCLLFSEDPPFLKSGNWRVKGLDTCQIVNSSGQTTGYFGAILAVNSAATVTLPASGELFTINGSTNITSVTASWPGRRVTLRFTDALTFTDGSNLLLAGNFTTSDQDAITLICDGTYWFEVGRSAN